MRENKLSISNKSMVAVKLSLVAFFALALALSSLSFMPVYAEVEPLCTGNCPPTTTTTTSTIETTTSTVETTTTTTIPECFTDEDCGKCPGWDKDDCGYDEDYDTLDHLISGSIDCVDGKCVNTCKYTHFCADYDLYDSITAACEAECDEHVDCPDYCADDTLYTGSCNLYPGDCACDYVPYDCNEDDGWYDTEETRWVETDQCNEKEQKEQEYQDWYCYDNEIVNCDYTVTETRWVDTGDTRYKPDQTPCDDEDLCTENDVCISGVCGGTPKDCSDLDDQCQEGVCNPSDGECYPDYSNYPLSTSCEADDDKCTIDHCDGYGSCVNYDYDDETPPVIEKSMFGNYLGDCPYGTDLEHGDCYVADNGESGVHVEVEDPLVNGCAIDDVSCYYELWWLIPEGEECPGQMVMDMCLVDKGEFNEIGDIIFTEDSEHELYIYCEDALENYVDHWETFLVDSTPPETIKEVGEPNAKWDGKNSKYYPDIEDYCWNGQEDQIECWKVTKDTLITMSCVDPEPHPVGVKQLCYEVELDGQDATEEYCDEYGGKMEGDLCCVYNGEIIYEFYFLEDSEHELEFYCVDELDNMSPRDIEKFKVEGEEFEIELNPKWNLISFPFVLLDGDPEEVFESVKEDVLLVLTYDAEDPDCVANGGWCVYLPNPDVGTIEEIKPGWGYWVLAEEGTILTVAGKTWTPGDSVPPSRSLVEGWNLIGYYGTDGKTGYYGPFGDGKEAFCTLHSLSYPTYEWSSLYSYWKTIGDIELSECTDMYPGAGYWIGMNQADPYYFQSTVCTGNPCS